MRGLAVATTATAVLTGALLAGPFPADSAYAVTVADPPSVGITVTGQVARVHGEELTRGTSAVITDNKQVVVKVAADDHGALSAYLILDGCGANTVTAVGASPTGPVRSSSRVIGACASDGAPGKMGC